MKNGQVIKNCAVESGELELINSYTRRELKEDEVYVFTVLLCDNDIDRDYERFTVESLEKLSSLFVGKTGIFDHNPKAHNQSARIISCKVENVSGNKNTVGDDYFRLTARAYMPITDSNRELREAIDSGIIREVSVGCAVEKTVCSICGQEINSGECPHVKGESYSGKLCYGELTNPYDAYEFSFTAIPAQKNAGVIKSYNGKESNMQDILKSIEKCEGVTLSKNDSKKLKAYIDNLKKQAADGVIYRNSLAGDVLKYSAVLQPEISSKTMKSITDSLSTEELKEIARVYKKMAQGGEDYKPQLYLEKSAKKNDTNTEFKI